MDDKTATTKNTGWYSQKVTNFKPHLTSGMLVQLFYGTPCVNTFINISMKQ